jgi:LEA14-like dessication related protein
MKTAIKLNIIIISIFILNGCSFIKPLELKDINTFSIAENSTKGVDITANITLYNPNKLKIKVNSADIDFYIEDVNFGKLQVPDTIVVPPKGLFTGEFKVKIKLMKLLLAGKNVLFKIKTGKIKIEAKGTINADVLWMHKEFIVDYSDNIKVLK